jgi:hypothetical protein
MSHFVVAVITDSLDKVEKLLAPYQENNMGTCPQEYLEFNDVEDEFRLVYDTQSSEMVKMEDGSLLAPYDDAFRTVPYGECEVPSHLERVNISHQERFPSFELYMEEYEGYKNKDEITGKYGYWKNPNAKWDWWTVGGRWSNTLILKSGKNADAAPIKDIFFIEDENLEEILTVTIEGFRVPAPLAPSFQIVASEASKAWDEVMDGKGFFKPEYFQKRYGSKEGFIKERLTFSTYGVVTPDGEWHEPGEMGWFGVSSASPEEAKQFSKSYYDTFIKTADPNHYLVLVDCHI